MTGCCARCRLWQPEAIRCAHCGDDSMVPHGALGQLLRPEVESVALIRKPPRRHGDVRSVLQMLAGALLGTAVGTLVLDGLLGGLGGALLGAASHRTRFWKTVVIRRPRLRSVAPPVKPSAAVFVGTVQPHAGTIGTLAPATPAVARAVVLRSAAQRQGVVLRAVRAVPFWLVAGKRRVLVTGSCWVGSPGQPREIGQALTELQIPMSLVPKRPFVEEAWIAPGDRIAVTGVVREQQVPGLGYREAMVETIEGQPGAVAWLEHA